MSVRYREFKTGISLRRQHPFQVGDRVETYNHCLGTVIRIDRDEVGVFIVVRLDILSGEFSYDPYDLEIIQEEARYDKVVSKQDCLKPKV